MLLYADQEFHTELFQMLTLSAVVGQVCYMPFSQTAKSKREMAVKVMHARSLKGRQFVSEVSCKRRGEKDQESQHQSSRSGSEGQHAVMQIEYGFSTWLNRSKTLSKQPANLQLLKTDPPRSGICRFFSVKIFLVRICPFQNIFSKCRQQWK